MNFGKFLDRRLIVTKKDEEGAVRISKKTRAVVADLQEQGRKVQVIGRLVNGKVEIDHASLNKMAKNFPNADMAFVAVNAPFDPNSVTP
jgi:hypothetical protein